VLRRVELSGRWWRSLLVPTAVVRSGRIALALPGLRGARLIALDSSRAQRVDAVLAAELAPTGLVAVAQLPRKADVGTLLRLSLRGSAGDALFLLLIAVAAGLAGLAVPLAAGVIFDEIVPGDERQRLVMIVVAVVCLAGGVLAASITQGLLAARIRTRADSSAGDAVWLRVLHLPASFFARRSVGDVLERASTVDALRQLLGDALVAAVVTGVSGALSVLLLFGAGPLPGVLSLTALAVELAAAVLLLRLRRRPLGEQAERGRVMQSAILQFVDGIDRVRVSAAEERVMAVIARLYAAWSRASYDDARIVSFLSAALTAWTTLSILAVAAGVVVAGGDGDQLGAFAAVVTALGQALAGVGGLISVAQTTSALRTRLSELTPLLRAEPEESEGAGTVVTLDGAVSLSNVTFRYGPQAPTVLDDVSLSAEPGSFIAVVGPSGSGKSTLVRLLLGFEAPEQGIIAYDGHDLAKIDLRRVRSQIGTVLQQAEVFPASIADNIRGSARASDEELWRAARLAGIADDIRRLPMRMETVVGAGTLSGGQQQRVLIARALVGVPRILIFDEATSALDNATQEHVSQSLSALAVTRIVVAHRLSTIRDADRIYVLERGRIVQHGGYEELVAAPGLFQELIRAQLLE
ncbi:MAG: ATP-binding cassette domain-containing protein, partial [Microbacterium sp.]